MGLVFVLLGIWTQYLFVELLLPQLITGSTEAGALIGSSVLCLFLVTTVAKVIGTLGQPVLREPLKIGVRHLAFCWQCGAQFAVYPYLLKAIGPELSWLKLDENWTLAVIAVGAVLWWGVAVNFLLSISFGSDGVKSHWEFVRRYYSTFRWA
jgi:hypothetical protein